MVAKHEITKRTMQPRKTFSGVQKNNVVTLNECPFHASVRLKKKQTKKKQIRSYLKANEMSTEIPNQVRIT